jgi:hypothetical protein
MTGTIGLGFRNDITLPLTMTFQEPRKLILTKEQLEWFQTSDTHKKVLSYIETLNEAIVGTKLTDVCDESEVRQPQLSNVRESDFFFLFLRGSKL